MFVCVLMFLVSGFALLLDALALFAFAFAIMRGGLEGPPLSFSDFLMVVLVDCLGIDMETSRCLAERNDHLLCPAEPLRQLCS